MALHPCLDCGKIGEGNRCPRHERRHRLAHEHRRGTARQRGYTRDYERNRDATLAASDVCWICGHRGADQADHVVSRARGGGPGRANLRPAHGTNPCPVCRRRCNQERGAA